MGDCRQKSEFFFRGPSAADLLDGPIFPNIKIVAGQQAVNDTLNHDVYTVPAGRRAIFQLAIAISTAGGSVVVCERAKINSNYFTIGKATAGTTGQPTTITAIPYIAEAGETLACGLGVGTVTTNYNFMWQVVEFDNTTNIKTVKIFGSINGSNPIYTCPAGKSALSFQAPDSPIQGNSLPVGFSNASGGSLTVGPHLVPAGGVSGQPNRVGSSTTGVANDVDQALGTASMGLNAGDFVSIDISAATTASQTMSWVNVLEY